MYICALFSVRIIVFDFVKKILNVVICTTTGDESLSGVKRTGILALLVTVRKLHPSDGSAKINLTVKTTHLHTSSRGNNVLVIKCNVCDPTTLSLHLTLILVVNWMFWLFGQVFFIAVYWRFFTFGNQYVLFLAAYKHTHTHTLYHYHYHYHYHHHHHHHHHHRL